MLSLGWREPDAQAGSEHGVLAGACRAIFGRESGPLGPASGGSQSPNCDDYVFEKGADFKGSANRDV
jgi:hypothetical protein